MANFEFQNFWPKKIDFFVMERPFYPIQSSNFVGMLRIYPTGRTDDLLRFSVNLTDFDGRYLLDVGGFVKGASEKRKFFFKEIVQSQKY